MAVYTGKSLVVLHGSNTLTHVRSASVSPSIDTVEITAAADTAKSFITTTVGFEASVDILEDDTASLTDTELVVGTSATLKIRPEALQAEQSSIQVQHLLLAINIVRLTMVL